jgi:hypothetical protein
MPTPTITRYTVDALVQARKIAGRTRSDGRGANPLLVDIRRVDSPTIDLVLTFEAHRPTKSLPGVPDVRRPSASLLWHGKRIRGIDWTIKHEVIRNGLLTGEVIRNWHEHYWTDEDGSDSIREPNPSPRNEDLSSLIEWPCSQWNIEGIQESMRLFT